ncbi:MAG TPA: DJ-1/PfpI family protein [Burkholderiaceae bacterium]|jgi:transcriptional regulator GlxA family with amidase domain
MKLIPTLVFIITLLHSTAQAADIASALKAPKNPPIKVAFVLSEGAVMIDFAGPWEVFTDVHLPGKDMDMQARMPFELYTVAPTKAMIHTSGNRHPGMQVTPDYDFSDAPEPDVVVLGAQQGGPGLTTWLKKIHADHKVILSVCTGAFLLAETGLLDGKQATTHHGAEDEFAQQYPKIKVKHAVRYVQSDPTIFTAGGLSSGIDLALHVVEEYYGREVAQNTANVMEYRGTDWKKP